VIGVLAMLLLVVYFASRPHVSVLGRVSGVRDAYGDVGRHPDYLQVPGLLVVRLEAPMFYANASLVCETIKRLTGAAEPLPDAVVVDFGPNSDLDITSAENLLELVKTLHEAGIDLGLAEVRQRVLERARVTGVLGALGEDHVFHTIDEAVTALASTG
jgi:MFS superfamily sulfate permease-like transporter